MLIRILLVFVFLISFQYTGFCSEYDTTVNRIFTFIYNKQFTEAGNTLEEQINQLEPFYYNPKFSIRSSLTHFKLESISFFP